MRKYTIWLFAIAVLVFPFCSRVDCFPTIEEKTNKLQRFPGYITFYWDAAAGKIWLEIDKWDAELLYLNSLPGGIGSNDIGLDRGRLGENRIVKFYRSGPRVLLLQPNYGFRTSSSNPSERLSVEESFAQSVLWGFEVAAEQGNRALVDASAFFLQDVHDVAGVLKETKQGDYKLESTRSAFYLPRTKNFPQNTEIEVLLTFLGESPGPFVRDVVPTPNAITVREHHSFIQLPDDQYSPRDFDPRAGYYAIRFLDFGAAVGQPLMKQLIARHRLQKKDPVAAVSEPVKPIIYWMDSGAPEPIRSALMEGASWWSEAFEAAGFRNAFQVRLLPQDADPMDVRYNVIQWVHRFTRGWSLGNTVVDPRTGEILKGHVTLGSQRVRQDYLIAEGLLAPYQSGKPVSPEMQEMALARLRQLAAHEVGHTLCLTHNFAASFNNRASVMDYPHPLVQIKEDGSFDLSQAYAKGAGEWDKAAIAFGYSQFTDPDQEAVQLKEILTNAISRGLLFVTDDDARPLGGAHATAHLWDNGKDPVQELQHILDVRRRALDRFSVQNIREGRPLSSLEEVLVPIYLFHRYQTGAVARLMGGLNYTYAVRGDGQIPLQRVSPEQQRKALRILLETIHPKTLALPKKIIDLIPPRAYGSERGREVFRIHTGLTFDPLAAAEGAANLTVGLILNPERAARLVEYHASDRNHPGLGEVIDHLISSTWKSSTSSDNDAEIQHVVDNVVLYDLMALAANEEAQSHARAIAYLKLEDLKKWLTIRLKITKNEGTVAHYSFAAAEIARFQKDPKQIRLTKPLDPPPGAPIGMDCDGP